MSLSVMTGCLLVSLYSFTQNLLPPNQPEQDACHALSLCGGMFSTPYSYQGVGLVADLTSTPCGSGEANSVWMKITIAADGVLVFNIIPIDTSDDYDFAVLEITKANCNSLALSNVVRCNFNNNYPGSNALGIVGLSINSSVTNVPDGFTGESFCQAIYATAGQSFLILINNFGHDDLTGPSKGFTIDFSASTAKFVENPPSSSAALP